VEEKKLYDLARETNTHTHTQTQTRVHVLSLSIHLSYLLYGNVRGKQEKDVMSLTQELVVEERWFGDAAILAVCVCVCARVRVRVCFRHLSRQRL